MEQNLYPKGYRHCPYCGSDNIASAEQEFKTDYPFWIVLVAVFLLLGVAGTVFILLQLHPVILILVLIAIATALLNTKSHRKKRAKKNEFICLDCEKRFQIK
ncbi:MAG: hypothetical protein U9Q97_07870 [Acidobacteriota bacterium]|nr:hypothetical protein [Acidobacteriota bacterium]